MGFAHTSGLQSGEKATEACILVLAQAVPDSFTWGSSQSYQWQQERASSKA